MARVGEPIDRVLRLGEADAGELPIELDRLLELGDPAAVVDEVAVGHRASVANRG